MHDEAFDLKKIEISNDVNNYSDFSWFHKIKRMQPYKTDTKSLILPKQKWWK